MTRRRVLCGLLLASLLLACFAGWLWVASGPRVTRGRSEQVKVGMSREEVIRTVGGPPGFYTGGRRQILGLDQDVDGFDAFWICDDVGLVVYFDEAGTVIHAQVTSDRPPTLTERIRRWLGL